MSLRNDFGRFLEREGLKQAYVARSLGISSSQISQWMHGKYKGDTSELEKSLAQFMRNYAAKSAEVTTEKIVELSNYRSAMFVADEAVVNREMAVLYGIPGSGKSVVARAFVAQHPEAIFIEVVPGIRVDSLLRMIAGKLGIGGVRAIDELVWAIAEEFKRRDGVLVIDEAEHLTVKGLEVLRRIYDFSGVPTILIGTYGLLKNLKGQNGELLQLYSRVRGRWEFGELSEEDMTLLFGDLAGVIGRYTRHLRRAVSLYEKAERFARMRHERLSAGHIQTASSMIFLD